MHELRIRCDSDAQEEIKWIWWKNWGLGTIFSIKQSWLLSIERRRYLWSSFMSMPVILILGFLISWILVFSILFLIITFYYKESHSLLWGIVLLRPLSFVVPTYLFLKEKILLVDFLFLEKTDPQKKEVPNLFRYFVIIGSLMPEWALSIKLTRLGGLGKAIFLLNSSNPAMIFL